ncbi:MAG: hypothetical protein ACRC2K_05215 [Clostridium sp.]
MNPTTKNMIQFFISCFGLSFMFALFTGKTLISIVIGVFISITMFYSPKKIDKMKSAEEATTSEKTE